MSSICDETIKSTTLVYKKKSITVPIVVNSDIHSKNVKNLPLVLELFV